MQKVSPVGCYFRLANEPTLGSIMELEIHIPAELVGQPTGTLLCQGKVVSVQSQQEGHTGVNCSIERYELIPEAADNAA